MLKFTSEIFGTDNLFDAGVQLWHFPPGGLTVLSATLALSDFLVGAYGINVGTTAAQIVADYKTILGRTREADELQGTGDDDLIQGAGGNDTIAAFRTSRDA